MTANREEHLEAELANWRELHEGMQNKLERQLKSLGWDYEPGQGLRAGIDWMADEIRRLRAERLELMAIRWPVEEWLDGRIITEELRQTVKRLIEKNPRC